MWVSSSSQFDNQTAQLLLVDDEPNIRQPLARALSPQGYEVQEAAEGHEAITLLKRCPIDLMVLDMHMPGVDGLAVMKEARKVSPELLIIVLTGHPTLDNAIESIRCSAVDYLRKPASVRDVTEAVARSLQKNAGRLQRERVISAMTEMVTALQQTRPLDEPPVPDDSTTDHVLTVGPLTLDQMLFQVTVDANPPLTVELSKGETAVLAGFMSQPNHTFSCSELVAAAWDYEADEVEAESIIRPYIFRLRRKLEHNARKNNLIRTVRGMGYLLHIEA